LELFCSILYFSAWWHTAERSWRLTYRRWRCCNISEHIIFLYGNYTLLSQNDTQININEIDDYRDCIIALNQSYGKKAFDESITTIKEQVERFKKKKEKIFEILGQNLMLLTKSMKSLRQPSLMLNMFFCPILKHFKQDKCFWWGRLRKAVPRYFSKKVFRRSYCFKKEYI